MPSRVPWKREANPEIRVADFYRQFRKIIRPHKLRGSIWSFDYMESVHTTPGLEFHLLTGEKEREIRYKASLGIFPSQGKQLEFQLFLVPS